MDFGCLLGQSVEALASLVVGLLKVAHKGFCQYLLSL
jgi:hypothetical protein